jgi:prepilin peptidase CpaA
MPALADAVRLTVVGLSVVTLAVAAVSDIRARRIPNWSVLAIIALFAIWAFVEPSVSLASSLGAAAIVFVLSAAFYSFGVMGAGDSKLMTAVALFAGLSHLPQFLVITAIAGGLMAVASLAAHPREVLVSIQTRRLTNSGRQIPYGVAIALSGAVTIAGASTVIPGYDHILAAL